MHFKKVLVATTTFGLMLSLAACGNKQSVSTSSSSSSASVSLKSESSSTKSQSKKYSEAQYAVMAYLKSAKKEGTNTGNGSVQVATNNNLKRKISDAQEQYTVTNTAKKVTVKSSNASYVFSKDQLAKSLQKNVENVNELLDESGNSTTSSKSFAKESEVAESSSSLASGSSSTSSTSSSSSSSSQSSAKMTAADARALLKEHVSAEREKAGLSGQSVSGIPTADDVDGFNMSQTSDGNWTATGTFNGQTVTYTITPSQVSSNK